MNKIISVENGVRLEWNDGKQIFVVPTNSVYTTFNKDTINFVLTSLPHNIGISLMSSLMSELEVDGVVYTSESELEKALNSVLNASQGLEFKVVDELPSEGKNGVIYLIKSAEEGENQFEEWIYVDGKWELLGGAKVDLDNYYTKDEVDEGNRVNAAAFNVLQKSIGLNENLETLSGKSIQAQIDELKEGGSSNAYEKVEGIEIATSDDAEYVGQVGILASTLEDGKWNPEFYLASDEDWSSHIVMAVNESDAVIGIYTADGNDVEIHSNRLTVYPSEGESFDIMYSDILTKDNQNYQIVDSLDDVENPQQGMMVYKKGEAQKIDIVTTDDVYYQYFKNFSNEIYIQVEDALFNANGEMWVEIGGTPIFQMYSEYGLFIYTDDKGFLYYYEEDSLRYNSATFNYNGSEYTFNFALTTIDGKKCVKMTVATPDDNMYFSTSYWYQNMETPIFYLGEPTEGDTYQYVEGNWKEFGGGNGYEKVEGINFIAPTEELPMPVIENQGALLVGTTIEKVMNEQGYGVLFTPNDIEIINGSEATIAIKYSDIKPIVTLTQSEYDALEEKDPNTVYLIKG